MASMDSMQSSERFGKSPRVARRHLAMEDIPEGPSMSFNSQLFHQADARLLAACFIYFKCTFVNVNGSLYVSYNAICGKIVRLCVCHLSVLSRL